MFNPHDLAGQAGRQTWERLTAPELPCIPPMTSGSAQTSSFSSFNSTQQIASPVDVRFNAMVYDDGSGIFDSNYYYKIVKYDQWFGSNSNQVLCQFRLKSQDTLNAGDLVYVESYSTVKDSPSTTDNGYLLCKPLLNNSVSEFVRTTSGIRYISDTNGSILFTGILQTGRFPAALTDKIFTSDVNFPTPIGSGVQTVTVYDLSGIVPGVVLSVDSVYVKVTSINIAAKTFTATFGTSTTGNFILGPVIWIQDTNGLYPVQDTDYYLAKPCWTDSSSTFLSSTKLVVYTWADLPSYCPGPFTVSGSINTDGSWTDMLVINTYIPGAWLCTWTGDTLSDVAAVGGLGNIVLRVITDNDGFMGGGASGYLNPTYPVTGDTPGSFAIVTKAFPACGSVANPIRFQAAVDVSSTFTSAEIVYSQVHILQVHDGAV